jgi:ABC-type transport system involved in cytochrome c biogenesis permease subunit
MKDNNFYFNQVFLNTLDSKAFTSLMYLRRFTTEQLLSFLHLENISTYISGKSFSILLAKASFGFLLISMLSYWFQLSFKSEMVMKSTNVPVSDLTVTSVSDPALVKALNLPAQLNPDASNPAAAKRLRYIKDVKASLVIHSFYPKGIPLRFLRFASGVSSFVKSIKSNFLEKVKKVPLVTMWFANITLAVLLFIRWVESGHFPLSNLYESLIFLSWSLTVIHLLLENLFYKKEQILDNTSETELRRFPTPLGYSAAELRRFATEGADVSLPFTNSEATFIAERRNVQRSASNALHLSGLLPAQLNSDASCVALRRGQRQKITCNESSVPTLTLGAITSPVALFTNAFATFSLPQEMQKVTVLVPALKSNWLIMHVSVMIISYAALLSGSLLAMAFLVIKFLNDNKIPSIVYTFINGVEYAKKRFTSLLAKLNLLNPFVRDSAALYPKGFAKQKNSAELISAKQLLTPSGYTRRGSKTISLAKLNSLLSHRRYASKANEINSELITPNPWTPSINDRLAKRHLFHPFNADSEAKLVRSATSISLPLQRSDIYFTPSCFARQGAELCKNIPFAAKRRSGALQEVQLSYTNKLVSRASSEEVRKVEENRKTKNFQFLDLPHILDNLSYRSISLGFALLTIGILSGAVWANEAWGSYWSWDPKETWAFITWLVFALYLHTRLSKGWVGKESAFVASFGFVVIWFCYLGVNLFGKGLHSYGWFQP